MFGGVSCVMDGHMLDTRFPSAEPPMSRSRETTRGLVHRTESRLSLTRAPPATNHDYMLHVVLKEAFRTISSIYRVLVPGGLFWRQGRLSPLASFASEPRCCHSVPIQEIRRVPVIIHVAPKIHLHQVAAPPRFSSITAISSHPTERRRVVSVSVSKLWSTGELRGSGR